MKTEKTGNYFKAENNENSNLYHIYISYISLWENFLFLRRGDYPLIRIFKCFSISREFSINSCQSSLPGRWLVHNYKHVILSLMHTQNLWILDLLLIPKSIVSICYKFSTPLNSKFVKTRSLHLEFSNNSQQDH